MTWRLRFIVTGLLACLACRSPLAAPVKPPPFAHGADISWVDRLEAHGVVYRDRDGRSADPLDLLESRGIDAVRLRVWVHPAGRWSTPRDLLREAERAKAHHMRILVDFHYSDRWADPGQQHTPAAWAGDDFPALVADLGRFTTRTLRLLKRHGIDVAWVQVGNEINAGLLWPQGRTPHFHRIAALLNRGYAAVKRVYPRAVVVLHLANGQDRGGLRWFLDHARAAGARWDAVGLSLYPSRANWRAWNRAIAANMRDLVDRYDCAVMVSEVGMPWDRADTADRMLHDLLRRTRAIGPRALGVFYWEPEAPPGWNGYDKGALDRSGRFTRAMDAFRAPGTDPRGKDSQPKNQ